MCPVVSKVLPLRCLITYGFTSFDSVQLMISQFMGPIRILDVQFTDWKVPLICFGSFLNSMPLQIVMLHYWWNPSLEWSTINFVLVLDSNCLVVDHNHHLMLVASPKEYFLFSEIQGLQCVNFWQNSLCFREDFLSSWKAESGPVPSESTV